MGGTKKVQVLETRSGFEDPEVMRELVRQFPEGIYATTPAGEIVDANPALLKILGVKSLEELRSLRAQDLMVDPALRAKEMELLERRGSLRNFEFQIRRPDGQVRTVLDTVYRSQDPCSNRVIYRGVLVDITGRKELENRLRQQSIR